MKRTRILGLILALGLPTLAQTPDMIINIGAETSTLDPSYISGVPEHQIYLALFEGLVTYDPKTCAAVPGVAKSWEWNDDYTQLTFKLRKSTWSDGTPITAQTVVDSWLRTLNPDTAAEYAYMINMVVKGAEAYNIGKGSASDVAIRALDDYTFQVDLIGPMPYALDMMAHYIFAILPMHSILKYGDNWVSPGKLACNGPYMMASWHPYEYIEVKKNPRYWDARNVKLERIRYTMIEYPLTAYSNYKTGNIDWSMGVPLELIDEILSRPDYQGSPQIATYYYIFNMERKPFDDVRVRKALAMALDLGELTGTKLKGGQIQATTLVPPLSGYEPPAGNAFNPVEARLLLAEAGYPEGRGFPELALLYNTSEGHRIVAEWAVASWKRNLGITIGTKNIEWSAFLRVRQDSHDFSIVRAGWVGDYIDPNTFLDMFLSDSGLNDGLYDNPDYDRLVRGAAQLSGAARMDALRQAEDMLITRDQHVIPLYYYANQDLIDLTVWDGWYSNPLGIHPPKYLKRKK